jgi:hypothetical protein
VILAGRQEAGRKTVMGVSPFLPVHLRIRGARAAEKATEQNSTRINMPLIGMVSLPPPEQLAYVGGIALLTALEVIDWPVGVALTAGHILSTVGHNKVLQDFGHALEAA